MTGYPFHSTEFAYLGEKLVDANYADKPRLKLAVQSAIDAARRQGKADAAPNLVAALKSAHHNLEHMAEWISKQNAGLSDGRMYSFEGYSEDRPSIRAAIAKAEERS
jgi:hypothetical protein